MQLSVIWDVIPVLCGRNVLTEGGGRFPSKCVNKNCMNVTTVRITCIIQNCINTHSVIQDIKQVDIQMERTFFVCLYFVWRMSNKDLSLLRCDTMFLGKWFLSKDHIATIFKSTQAVKTAYPWKWKWYDPVKHWEPITRPYSITSKKSLILINTTVRT